MNEIKYIGMDVHMAMTVVTVLNSDGCVTAKAIIETKQESLVDFVKSQRGIRYITFEEQTQAAWLYDLLCPHAEKVVVCDPRKLPPKDNKGDDIDSRDLAELLRVNGLSPVYHGENSTRELKELVRSYTCIRGNRTRSKNRIKGLFRARGIRCCGVSVYGEKDRAQWAQKLTSVGARNRLLLLWKELDFLTELLKEAENNLRKETRKHKDIKILKGVPGIGPTRAAVIISMVATPHRFRTAKQLWAYSGLAVRSKASAEYEIVDGRISRSKKRVLNRGLNRNYNPALKEAFKGAAASAASGPWKRQYNAMIENGTESKLALLTFARKIAAITLAIWKKGEHYNGKELARTHAA